MVERRPLLTVLTHAVLILGVLVVASYAMVLLLNLATA